jgi:hypothetical protein
MVRVHPPTQMVWPMVSCVTDGLRAPGVRAGSGRALCADAAPIISRASGTVEATLTAVMPTPRRMCRAVPSPLVHPLTGKTTV